MVDWNAFRTSIDNVFYNEKIDIYEVVSTTDDFGAVIENGIKAYAVNVDCNIQNTNRDIVKKEFGKEIDAVYRITLSNVQTFDKDKIYIAKISSTIKSLDSNTQYEVVAIQPFNSYVLILLNSIEEQYSVVVSGESNVN